MIGPSVKLSDLPTPWKKIDRRTIGRGGDRPRGIVIHTCEGPEVARGARNVATWFSHPDAPSASAHYAIDDREIVGIVEEVDTAWHAGPVNPATIGIELQGHAAQGPEGWADDYSIGVLALAAQLCAAICIRYEIPVERPSPEELGRRLREGEPIGIVGHADVTAMTGRSGHWDPGPDFPWDHFLGAVEGMIAHYREAEKAAK